MASTSAEAEGSGAMVALAMKAMAAVRYSRDSAPWRSSSARGVTAPRAKKATLPSGRGRQAAQQQPAHDPGVARKVHAQQRLAERRDALVALRKAARAQRRLGERREAREQERQRGQRPGAEG